MKKNIYKSINIYKNKYINNNLTNLYIKICLILFLSLISIILFLNLSTYNSTIEKYIHQQKDFCHNLYKYYNKEIEAKMILVDIKINKLNFTMYVPLEKNTRNHSIIKNHFFELKESLNIINALNYYKNIKNIKINKNIYILDIGGNIGWYPSLLGRFGYSILSFEPFEKNYYFSRKNYCHLNQESNVIIINKGLYNIKKDCYYYKDNSGIANGMILCDDNNKNKTFRNRFKKAGIVSLTRLSSFIRFLSNKNVALIKLDVEGSEGKVIESGIDLITKFHVPFIFIEFTPKFLLKHKTNPKKFIELFINNGYKISLNGFLNKDYISYDELMKRVNFQINCYLIYEALK